MFSDSSTFFSLLLREKQAKACCNSFGLVEREEMPSVNARSRDERVSPLGEGGGKHVSRTMEDEGISSLAKIDGIAPSMSSGLPQRTSCISRQAPAGPAKLV